MNRKTFKRTTVEAAEIDVRVVGPERDEKLRNSRSHQMGGWAHRGTDYIMEQTMRCTRVMPPVPERPLSSLWEVSSTEKTKSK
jgi:hypothetical protein